MEEKMSSEKEDPGGGPLPSAALAALTVVVGGVFWCGGMWLFGGAGSPGVRVAESSSVLAPLILFAVVGSVLLVAGMHGLCQWSRHPRDRHAQGCEHHLQRR
jgi:hypothetical protein